MRQLISIFWRNKLLVAIVVSVFIVYATHWIPDAWVDKRWDDRLRFAGGFLQLLGIYVVVAGMQEKRALFNLDSLWREQIQFFQALRSHFRPGVGETTGSVHGVLSTLQGGGSASANAVVEPGGSDRARIVALEKAQEVIAVRIAGVEMKLRDESTARTAAIHAERAERDTQDRRLDETIRRAIVGDISFDLAGVIWIFLGIVLATYSPEIAKLFEGGHG